jgi:hypothetical protein
MTAADLDNDWGRFDNIRLVTLRIRAADDSLGTSQTVQALELSRDVSDAGVGDGFTAEDERMIPLRASMVTGTITPRSEITDWNGVVRHVRQARLVSWGTRWQCFCH